MVRKPVVSGQFYPQTSSSLTKMLSGLVGADSDKQDARAVIMPHAGYIYSGQVAGATISKVDIKKTVIILGTNHTGSGEAFSIMTEGSWETPLGEVKIDIEIAESILNGSTLLKKDIQAHLWEHSIEVELPFLQYFRKDVKIVPVVVSHSDLEDYQLLGKEIADGYARVGRQALFMASTDFTHYEPKEIAEKKDALAIEAILCLDEEKLFNAVRSNDISMCGAAPTCTLISACRHLGAQKAGLVKYQTSGDISGDYSSVVGYAGIIIC